MSNLLEFESKSTNISNLRYDPDNGRLYVTFHSGAHGVWADVPPTVFAEMTRHPSMGRYFHNVIQRHYRRVEYTRAEKV